MPKWRCLLLALPALLWGDPVRSAPPAFHLPGADLLLGIQVQRILQQGSGQELRRQFSQTGLVPPAQLDSLEAIEQICLSTRTSQFTPETDPPLLITLHGRFELDKLRQFARSKRATSTTYRGLEVLSPANAGINGLHVALVSPETVLLADRRSLRQVIDGINGRASTTLAMRAEALASRHDVWMVAAVPPEAVQREPRLTLFRDVRSVEVGASLGELIHSQVRLRTGDSSAADRLVMSLQTLLGLAQAQAAPAKLLQQVEVKAAGDAALLTFALDTKQIPIAAAIQQAVTGDFDWQRLMRDLPAKAPDSPPATPVRAAVLLPKDPPAPQFIRIYGLESGPREIPFGPTLPAKAEK